MGFIWNACTESVLFYARQTRNLKSYAVDKCIFYLFYFIKMLLQFQLSGKNTNHEAEAFNWTITCSGVTGGGGGGAGGQSAPPETSDREIFADVSGKKRQGKKGKGVKLRRKGGKLEMEVGKRQKKRWGPFFFFFHFWKRRKFVLGLPKWEFSTGKKHFTPGKKSGKMTLPPQKICLLRPWLHV